MVDRGEDATRVLWLLYRLEREAEDADGQLHIVLGNHELMVMLDDLRYVSAKEQTLARLHGITYDRLFDPRHSILGRWLASKPALIRIDDILFAHGGVSPAWLAEDVESVDDSLAAFVGEELFFRWADTTFVPPLDSAALTRRNDFFWEESSILWYRGYAQEDTLGEALGAVLDRYRATVHVVGHTPDRTIRQRYGGRLIATNTIPFAAELLLLIRSRDRWDRYRIGTSGAPAKLEPGASGR
ncbi:MAG: metallophosphoesterase, partial [Longimicrobiales bacterium]